MSPIVRVTDWPGRPLDDLVHESELDGFRFLRRLRDEWRSAENRFSGPGEALFVVYSDSVIVAVGGINREADEVGRLRRFYVKKAHRRTGIGRRLTEHLLAFATPHYAQVRLRTGTDEADQFYVAMGFQRVDGDTHTHELTMPGRRSGPA